MKVLVLVKGIEPVAQSRDHRALGNAARATRAVSAGSSPVGSEYRLLDHLHANPSLPPEFADSIRPLSGSKGELHNFWRAVDQNGVVLDILEQRRRDTLLQTSAQRPTVYAARPRHGQAEELRRSQARTLARHGPSREPFLEQSSGEPASTDPTERATDAALQVSTPGSAFHIRSRLHLRAPSANSQPLSCRACKSFRKLDTGDVRPKLRMIAPL